MALLSHVSTWAVGAVLLVLLLRRFMTPGKQIRRHGKCLRKAPDTLPLVGNGILFMRERHKLFAWFTKCERLAAYETLQVSVPTLPPGVVVHDPRNLDFIFRNESLFSKGDFVKSRAWDLFGHGIINADGEAWRLQRKAGAAFLSTANLRVLTDVALPRFLGEELERLGRVADADAEGEGVVDLQEVFHEITTRLMGKMAYNMDMHTDDAFTTAFDHASGATAERFQNPLWFLTENLTGRRFRRSVKIVKSFGQKIVASAVADRHDSTRSTPDPRAVSDADSSAEKLDQISGTLIHSFLDTIPDHQIVADAALNYLSAGRDTTAQALTWTFHLLFRSPSALRHIRDEALAVLDSAPPKDSHSDSSSPLARLTPQALPYTLAAFYEALRLYPPIPLEIKQLVSDHPVALPDGTVLPPDAVVVWCPWALGRSRRTWGPDADQFRPERWLVVDDVGGKTVMVQRPASEFPVFNGGPRSCLGKKMAEVIGVQVVAAMAVGFDFAPADGMGDGGERGEKRSKISLTLPMEGGLPVTVRRRT